MVGVKWGHYLQRQYDVEGENSKGISDFWDAASTGSEREKNWKFHKMDVFNVERCINHDL